MRVNWTEYFLELAELVSTRATCDRLHVGCVLVKNNRMIATGYNGSLPNQPHCDTDGHLMVKDHCVRTVHAEANAIANAAKSGHRTEMSIAYVTHRPCFLCLKLLTSAGVHEVIYTNFYGEEYPDFPVIPVKQHFKDG